MGKHASGIDKAAFLVYLQYIYQAKAARRAGEVQIRNVEQGLPPPTLAEQVVKWMICDTYEVLEPYLIPFYKEIMLQRHNPNTFECN